MWVDSPNCGQIEIYPDCILVVIGGKSKRILFTDRRIILFYTVRLTLLGDAMFQKPISIFNTFILLPLRRNSAMALFLLGILVIAAGAVDFGLGPRYSDILVKIGSAILGAGVFAVIMKSAQFSELFQQHIADVIYDPYRVENSDFLLPKWRLITNAIVQGVLPSTYDTAVNSIEKRYFDNELDYHFEGYEASYDIVVDRKTTKATVTSTMKSILVISPKRKKPTFQQKIRSDSPATLTSLIINDKTIKLEDTEFVEKDGEKILSFDLVEHSQGKSSVKLERTFVTIQGKKEPYIAVTISRFIKGAVIKAKITTGFEIRFLGLGIEKYDTSDKLDGRGYKRWTLAEPNALLLPGQGYTLVFVQCS
jgi:hypothetical protein